MKTKTVRWILILMSLSFLGLSGCTREGNQEAKLSFSIAQPNFSKGVGALTADYRLMHIVVNVRGEGLSKIHTFHWDADFDDSGGTTHVPQPPSEIIMIVPPGNNRLIQYMGVYMDINSGNMNFHYGDALQAVDPGDNFVTINSKSIAASSGTEHQIAGRYKTTATNGPTGTLAVMVQPPAAEFPDRPPMLLMKRDMIGGWFSAMLIEGIKFQFRLLPQKIDLFALDPAVDLTAVGDSLMHVYAPAHKRNGNSENDLPWNLHLAYFGPGANGNEKVCFRNSGTQTIDNITKVDGSTPIQWNPGTVSDASAEIYRLGGINDDHGTYASFCADQNNADTFMFEYHNLSNGVHDGIGIMGPFMTNFNSNASQGMVLTDSGPNLEVQWKFLPGLLNTAHPMSGLAVFVRPRNQHDDHVRGDDMQCNDALMMAGFHHVADVPAPQESFTIFGANESDTAVALCPYTDAFGPRLFFSSFLQRGSEGSSSGPGPGPGPGQQATQIKIFPLGNFTDINRNICYPFEVQAQDADGNVGFVSGTQTISLSDTTSDTGDVSFHSDPGCSNGITDVTFNDGNFGHRMIYVNILAGGTADISATNGNLADDSYSLNIGMNTSEGVGAGAGMLAFIQPEVYKFDCVPVYIMPRDASSNPAPSSGIPDVYFDDSGQGGAFYSQPNCTSAITNIGFSTSDGGKWVFYQNNSIGAQVGTNIRIGDSGLSTEFDTKPITLKVPGNDTRTFTVVEPFDPSHHELHTGLCYPVKVYLKDDQFNVTAATQTRTATIIVDPAEATLYTDAACTTGAASSNSVTLSPGEHKKVADLFIRPKSSNIGIDVETPTFTTESFGIYADRTKLVATPGSANTNSCAYWNLQIKDSLSGTIPASEFNGNSFNVQLTSSEPNGSSGLSISGGGCTSRSNPDVFVVNSVTEAQAGFYFYTGPTTDSTHTIDFTVIGEGAGFIDDDIGVLFTWAP